MKKAYSKITNIVGKIIGIVVYYDNGTRTSIKNNPVK